MESTDQMNLCAICLGGMGVGGGQAIFMAECSHMFHFHCISARVAHGHQLCPVCNTHGAYFHSGDRRTQCHLCLSSPSIRTYSTTMSMWGWKEHTRFRMKLMRQPRSG
nr:uncharacterized protein LOC127330551 [Lolium perenne]